MRTIILTLAALATLMLGACSPSLSDGIRNLPITHLDLVVEWDLRFGLGGADRIDRITVVFPSGAVSEVLDVPTNARILISAP